MFVNVLVVIAIVGPVLIVGSLEVTEEVTRYLENKKLDKKLHNDWVNKTGVYAYLKK